MTGSFEFNVIGDAMLTLGERYLAVSFYLSSI